MNYENFCKKLKITEDVNHLILNETMRKEKLIMFAMTKAENPKMTQKEICKHLGTSESTIRRERKDLGMDSPYRHTVKIKRKKKTLEVKPGKPIEVKKKKKDKYASGEIPEGPPEEISDDYIKQILSKENGS